MTVDFDVMTDPEFKAYPDSPEKRDYIASIYRAENERMRREPSTSPAPSLGWDVHRFDPGYSRMNDECQANNGACLLPRDHATHSPASTTGGHG
jgi:hypothetical protein